MTPSKLPPLLGYERGIRLLIACALLTALVAVGWFSHFLPHLPCTFHQLTGLPCPLCGGTRATTALLHGDLSRAARLNAIAIPAVLLGITAIVLLLFEAATARRLTLWDRTASLLGKRGWLLLIPLAIWWAIHIARWHAATRGL